jgi:photosystem II stability/assembly factor-like uncharacterized protein
MTTRTLRLVALAAVLTGPLAARATQWRLVGEIPIKHTATVVAFQDDQNGITAGYAGTVFFTHDGGKSWTRAVNSSACRYGVEALPGVAWTAGNYGHVRVSKDGGEHWSAAASWRKAQFLSFLDATRGLIASGDELAITADAGQSWTDLLPPAKAGPIAAVSLSEEAGVQRIRLLDENGALWLSDDRGASWAPAQSPLRSPVFQGVGPHAAMRFTSTGEGVLAFMPDEIGSAGRIYRTRDGGRTWQEEVTAGVPLSLVTLAADAKLLTSFDQHTIRLYRAE